MRGGSCAMYPSCSNYGLLMFSNRSFWPAVIETAERMTRCGHDMEYYPQTLQFGEYCALDFPLGMKENETLAIKETYDIGQFFQPRNENEDYIHSLITAKLYEAALSHIIYLKSHEPEKITQTLYAAQLLCYEKLGREEDGILTYEKFPTDVKENSIVLRKYLRLYASLENYNKALNISKSLNDANILLYRDLNYRGYLYAMNHDYTSALTCFRDANAVSPSHSSISQSNISNTEIIMRTHWKKSAIAGWLSIVPGLGYAYTKNYKTAITAFVVNSLLTYTVFQSFHKRDWGLGAIFCSLNLAFYIGNISGASKSAHRYNEHIHDSYIKKLRQTNIIDNY